MTLFFRYALEFAMLYPAAYLCLSPVRQFLDNPWRAAWYAAGVATGGVLLFSAMSVGLGCSSNMFLLPAVLLAFYLYRRVLGSTVPMMQSVFVFSVTALLLSVCALSSTVLCAKAERANPDPVYLPVTSLVCFGLGAAMCVLSRLTMSKWLGWLIREFHVEKIWRVAWLLPAVYALFLVFAMPMDASIILINRLQQIFLMALTFAMIAFFLLIYLFYTTGQAYEQNLRLTRENQVLAIESRRYTELHAHMDETRRMRHDFRQHLRVIAGLAENGRLEELKSYLQQYEQEASSERHTLCRNAAVDAIAGYYDQTAQKKGVPVRWRIDIPEKIVMSEADLCVALGNLLENALRASEKLPPEARQVEVFCRLISPAMLGLVVENRYNGCLKREGGAILSTEHDGAGQGLTSVETIARKYRGQMTVETKDGLFRVNVLFNF